jgi:hypothetical protein
MGDYGAIVWSDAGPIRGRSPERLIRVRVWEGPVRCSVGENFERYPRSPWSQDPDRQCNDGH